MFKLCDTPINVEGLHGRLHNLQAGAVVTFEGRVRDHNDGQTVRSLEYQAYEMLAAKEGERILAEARQRFAIYDCVCEHRTGHLQLGDIAVFVGVSAAHRGPAFEACRWIIDEIKRRLPIWKKEYYQTGDSSWVNCRHVDAACGSDYRHATTSGVIGPDNELYERQVSLDQIGVDGQKKLLTSRVLVVGAGGLGCPALSYLAAAGAGTLGICDGDLVEASNLHRQVLFGVADVGAGKASVAARKISELYPHLKIVAHQFLLNSSNAPSLLDSYDVVLDCTDNFQTKFLLNDLCRSRAKILIQASVYQFEGQLSAAFVDGSGQCLRCLWEQVPEANCVSNCAQAGIVGATVGVFGSLQAMEAIKAICGLRSDLAENIVFFDLLSLTMRKVKRKKNESCKYCCASLDFSVESPVAQQLVADDSVNWQLDILELSGSELNQFELVDIREPDEDAGQLLKSLLRRTPLQMPLSKVVVDRINLDQGKQYLFICQRGRRSDNLVAALRARGFHNVFSLTGGVEAIRRKFIA